MACDTHHRPAARPPKAPMLVTVVLLVVGCTYVLWVRPQRGGDAQPRSLPGPGVLRISIFDGRDADASGGKPSMRELAAMLGTHGPQVVVAYGLPDHTSAQTLADQMGRSWRRVHAPPGEAGGVPVAILISPTLGLTDRYLLDVNGTVGGAAVSLTTEHSGSVAVVCSCADKKTPESRWLSRLLLWLDTHQAKTVVVVGEAHADSGGPDGARFRQSFGLATNHAGASPVYVAPATCPVRDVGPVSNGLVTIDIQLVR